MFFALVIPIQESESDILRLKPMVQDYFSLSMNYSKLHGCDHSLHWLH